MLSSYVGRNIPNNTILKVEHWLVYLWVGKVGRNHFYYQRTSNAHIWFYIYLHRKGQSNSNMIAIRKKNRNLRQNWKIIVHLIQYHKSNHCVKRERSIVNKKFNQIETPKNKYDFSPWKNYTDGIIWLIFRNLTIENTCGDDKKSYWVNHSLDSLLIVNYNPLLRLVHLTHEHLPYMGTIDYCRYSSPNHHTFLPIGMI